jgi:hypothetical protein
MKKLISSLITIALLITSLGSLSALAATSTPIPLDGTVVTADVPFGDSWHSFDVPYRTGVTDVTFWIEGLPEGYDIFVEGNNIDPVIVSSGAPEVVFTVESLKGGTYDLIVLSESDDIIPEEGSQYRIHVEDTLVHASHNEADPTPLTEGVSFGSNLYDGRNTDYYTFTLTEDRNVHISINPIPISHHYQLEISGNGMYPYTVSSSGDFFDVNVDYLDAGQYYLKLKGDWRVRTEPSETFYSITYTTSEITE